MQELHKSIHVVRLGVPTSSSSAMPVTKPPLNQQPTGEKVPTYPSDAKITQALDKNEQFMRSAFNELQRAQAPAVAMRYKMQCERELKCKNGIPTRKAKMKVNGAGLLALANAYLEIVERIEREALANGVVQDARQKKEVAHA